MAEKFRPVQGSEHDIKNSSPVEGYLYFATDTKKIYLAKEGNYLPMGGNSGIYYGNRLITEEEEILELTSFIFTTEDIEGDQTPNVNDLILNIPDGCFYRVMDVSEDGLDVTAERLTIAGSGSGGSGGGGTGTGTSVPVVNDPLKGEDQYFISSQGAMNINFYCSSQAPEGNRIETVEYYIGTNKIHTDNKGYEFNETITFDISPYVGLLNPGTRNTLAIKAIDIYGNESKRKNFFFYLINLQLISDFDTIYKLVDSSELIYPCKPQGGAGLTERYVRITMAPVENPTNIKLMITHPVKSTGSNINIPVQITESCDHGVYVLKSYFCGLLPNGEEVVSAEMSHQIVYYKTGNSPLIAGHVPSNRISQYDTIIITYMIVDEQATTATSEVLLYTDNNSLKADANLGAENYWKKTFNETGIYTLDIEYKGQRKNIAKIEVLHYEGDLPTIDEMNLELYLTSQGRSNTESNKESWVYKNIEGKFENFLWGNANGWLEDKSGQTALKLTNGAKFSLPTYHPFASDATQNGLTIELDVMFSGVLDYSKPLIQCLSIDGSNTVVTGFHITGQKATLNSSINKATTMTLEGEEDAFGKINDTDMALQAFTQYYNENERLHLTYVIERIPSNFNQIPDIPFYFVYTYLNGVMSGIMKMNVDKENQTKEQFLDANGFPSYIQFDSTYGDINIYNIRVYRGALDSRAIINNYIADLTNIDEKIELYKINNIFDDSTGLISLNAIQDISYQLKVPYVLFKGGSVMPKKFKEAITYTEAPKYALPVTKSDYRLMSMQMFDRVKDNEKPIFEVPIELEDSLGNKVTDFKDIKLNTAYTMNRGVQVYGQGTSSMVYPVKNLRLKFRKEEDYPVIYNGAYPVEIACFKADFMDSSASHNTGTANLVYDLLASMNLRSPAQQFKFDHSGKEGVAAYDLLTAIRGFPIVCFYTEGDKDEYTYIGRYNFNIDKATPEPFGFFPQKVYTGKTTTDEQGRERKEVEVAGLKTEVVNGMTVLPLDANGKEIERDIIQCWEMLNNDNGSPVKFLTPDGFNNFDEALKTKHNWMNYYEDRYPDAMVSGAKFENGNTDEDKYPTLNEDLENGIFRLAKWINSTAVPYSGEKSEVTNKILETPVYYPTRDEAYVEGKQYYEQVSDSFIEKIITKYNDVKIEASKSLDENFPNSLIPTINVGTFAEKVNNKFDQYTFVFTSENPTTNPTSGLWHLEQITEEGSKSILVGSSLDDYGITYTGTPTHTNSIIVNFYETNDWASSLYEKYTIDNESYRLAKFKAEFTQYFNLDFALFYYILTMVLLMMDSRAKNMMLASWDQTIWYPIFYDMDTGLGLNNTGFNKFAYDTEDDPKDKVFNGFDSVLWNNFRTCFYSDICKFYSEMRKHLTIDKLLKTYNTDASDKWNEALTTADAEYKYIRPYEEGYYDGKEGIEIKPNQVSYLYAGQGKRTNHRSYWLNNRVKYFDSKYIPSTYGSDKPSLANSFSFRAYALPAQKSTDEAEACIKQTPANHQFDITALNNSYQSIFIGNIVYGPKYTLANQTVTLGPTQVKHEVESYILNPSLIMSLGDLSDKYLGDFKFPGVETRLTELNFGRSSRSHKDNYDKYYNSLLFELNIGESCPYLQKVNIARCTGLKSIELNKCPRLRELDAEGTTLTNISFPANSILEKIYLPNTLTSLTLTNQPYLSLIEFDNLAIGTNSINTIVLDKISAMDTYPIVKGVFANQSLEDEKGNKTFFLTNVNWLLENSDDVILEGNKITGITILEKLLKANCRGSYNHSQSLSGTITINVNNTEVNQFEIYNKYNKKFPNVTIKYGNNVTVEGAKKVIFYDNDIVEKAQVFYEVLTDGTQKLETLISEDGPNGIALRKPSKAPTNEYAYEFTGRWMSEDIIYTTIKKEIGNPYPSLYDLIPNKAETKFYPIYETTANLYEIKFYDYDGSFVYHENLPWHYSFSIPNFVYRDSSDLGEFERWAFKGWTLEKNPIKPIYVDTSNLIVTGDLTLYAQYEKENVKTVASNLEYFEFKPTTVKVITGNKTEGPGGNLIDETISYDGYEISVRNDLRRILAGKITLPIIYEKDGVQHPIIKVGDFGGCELITHVFFKDEEHSQYLELGPDCFSFEDTDTWSYYPTSLVAFYAPTSIKNIKVNAFKYAIHLKDFQWNDGIVEIGDDAFRCLAQMQTMPLKMKKLPESLIKLGSYAFYKSSNDDVIISNIPSGLQKIGDWAFYPGNNITITNFSGSLESIGSYAFAYAGKNIKENTLYIGRSVTKIGNNAFGISNQKETCYGHTKIQYVNIANPETTFNLSAAEMGFRSDVQVNFNYNPETEVIA